MELTINEVAKSLDLPRSTVERWIRQGRIPIRKSGDNYTFDQAVLEKWAHTHNLLFSPPRRECSQTCMPESESLCGALRQGGVFYQVPGDTVEAVLRSAVDRMETLSTDMRDELYERLLQREQLTSTGIGKGIAIPHPRTPLSECTGHSMIFTCFPEHLLDFRAIDRQPVFVLFILLSMTPKCHLQLLSRLSFCVRDDAFMAFLKTVPEPEALLNRIAEVEASLDHKGPF